MKTFHERTLGKNRSELTDRNARMKGDMGIVGDTVSATLVGAGLEDVSREVGSNR